MTINELTGIIVDSCVKIHTAIGPGCYERVYEELLCYELQKKGINCRRQITLPIFYEDLYIEDAYRLDVLVEENVILEIKCVEHIIPVHFKQLTTYLKLAELKNGVLLNFKTNLMKDGIYRVFNNQGECRQSYLDKK